MPSREGHGPQTRKNIMDENLIADRIARVRDHMERAAARRGVPAETITLMGVTKKMGAEPIQAAYAAGLRTFGENYIQEALTKVGQTGLDWPDAQWHFIGHLQRNKARDAAGRFALIQSVDSLELARELAKREGQRGRCAEILLEARLDESGTKFGIEPGRILDAASEIDALENVNVRGLMALAPFSDNPEDARPYFRRLYQLFAALPDAMRHTLSMGMTGDFEVAIEEGATLIRIGTAIFGPRR